MSKQTIEGKETLYKWAGDYNNEIEIIYINGEYVAICGWNGESYTNCWKVSDLVNDTFFENIGDYCNVYPVYKEDKENECFDIVGYTTNTDIYNHFL